MDLLTDFQENWKLYVAALVILIGAFFLTRFVRWSLNRIFSTVSKKINTDSTRFHFIKNGASMVVWIMALASIVSMFPKLRAIAVTLFAGAGILVAIMGFAAQSAFANIISGIVMVIFEPFKVGDVVRVGDEHHGVVTDITLRHTVINSLENRNIIIPNSTMSSATIINESIYSNTLCLWVNIGISYDSDVQKAMAIMREVAGSFDEVIPEPGTNYEHPVNVRVLSYGDFSVDLRAYVWTNQPLAGMELLSKINIGVKERFDKEGIEIPFPHRTLLVKEGHGLIQVQQKE